MLNLDRVRWTGLLWVWALGPVVLAATMTDTLPTIYMENHCQPHFKLLYLGADDYIDIEDSLVVELTADADSSGHLDCIATFVAKEPGQRILLHFLAVDINYNPGTADRLRIYDGYDARVELTPQRGLYGKYSKGGYQFNSGDIDRDYTTDSRVMKLHFVGDPSASFNGFKALLTVFKPSDRGGACELGYLKCEKWGFCIKNSLHCNGYDNCGLGDDSDSTNCGAKPQPHHTSGDLSYSTNLGLMVGCALSIVILMVVVLWLGIVCLKKTRWIGLRRRQMAQGAMVEAVDGAVVEPSEIHRVMSPPVSFLEPPPLYSEEPTQSCGVPGLSRFELPPPYSLDERDTAGLLLNESHAASPVVRPDLIPPESHVSHSRMIRVRRVLPMSHAVPCTPPNSTASPYNIQLRDGTPVPGEEVDNGAEKFQNDIPEYFDVYMMDEEQSNVENAARQAAELDLANGNVNMEVLHPIEYPLPDIHEQNLDDSEA